MDNGHSINLVHYDTKPTVNSSHKDRGINYNSNKHLVVISAAVELAENPGPRVSSGCQTGGHHGTNSLVVVVLVDEHIGGGGFG